MLRIPVNPAMLRTRPSGVSYKNGKPEAGRIFSIELLRKGYLINWFISKMGKQIDNTIKPTTQPITKIMIGSR